MKTKALILFFLCLGVIVSGCKKDNETANPPTISNVTLDPVSPGAVDEVTVSAVVEDEKGISTVKLFYKTSEESSFTSSNMIVGNNSTYSAVIPAYESNTIIQYYIQAISLSGSNMVYPSGAPTTFSSYTVGASAIVINEIFSRGTEENPDWIELYNKSESSINIGNYRIYDENGQSGSIPKMVIPAGTTIAAKGFYVIVVDDADAANPVGSDFGLSSSGEDVWIESASGYVIDNVSFPAMPDITTSYGRTTDGGPNFAILTLITKNIPNTATAPQIANVNINPVEPMSTDNVTVSATVTDAVGVSKVELFYKTTSDSYNSVLMTSSGNIYSGIIPAQAAGSVVSYYIESTNSFSLVSHSPSTAPATPASYTLLSASFITNFAINPLNPTALESPKVFAIITDPVGIASVKLYYKIGSGDYTSISMNASGDNYSASIPAQQGGTEISYYIEVTNLWNDKTYAPADALNNPATYTVAGPILINEIFSQGSDTDPDWIEIYNLSGSSIDIGGYKIYDDDGQEGTQAKMEFATGTIIPAHGYYVIVVNDAATANPSGSDFGLSKDGEGVWLENATGAVIDYINYGATTEATQSYGRQPDGTSNWKVLTSITKGSSNGSKK